MTYRKYFITGGGTGGHIYPAIAIADRLLELDEESKIFYVGNPCNMEYEITKDKNYEFLGVKSSGMPRGAKVSLIKWGFEMFFAFLVCVYYVFKYRPDVIFGTGGYVSAPTILAGIFTRTPVVMHDCDANPGLVTRKIGRFANFISLAFDGACDKIPNKNCKVFGNPIRNEFSTLDKISARKILDIDLEKLTICIMGGSLGAKKINTSAVKILKTLSNDLNCQIIFQTGKKNFDECIKELKEIYPEFENDKNIIIRPYFDNMPVVLKSSDIVISRSGSLSISEICASDCAPIFIPYPYAASDHQRKNAKFMEQNNAGLYLEDSDTTAQTLLSKINELKEDKNKFENIKKSCQSMAKFDACENIINKINEVINKNYVYI